MPEKPGMLAIDKIDSDLGGARHMQVAQGEAPATASRRSGGYQTLVVGLLSLNFGIVFFDRNALNFLMTFVKPELGLSNTQVGFIAGAFAFTWAIAAFGISRMSDLMGNRKLLLVICTLAFCACSFLTGLAGSFLMLLGARLLMGVAEGGVMPISHAMVASEVAPEHRGLAQGVAQNLGSSFFGSFLAPIVLVWFAQQYGWREAFYLAGIPGILSALLIWILIKDNPPPRPVQKAPDERGGFSAWLQAVGHALKIRNIWVCVVLGVLLVAYLVICWAFMQLFLTQVRGYSEGEAGLLMGVLGLSAMFCSFFVAWLSDRIGRRPIMMATPFIAVVLPLAAIYFTGSFWAMAVLFFVGWSVNGIFPLFMATVPSESVPASQAATVFGLCMGSCEILGGVLGPFFAGIAADAYGQIAPLWMMTGLAIVAGFVAMFLKETAPAVLARRAA